MFSKNRSISSHSNKSASRSFTWTDDNSYKGRLRTGDSISKQKHDLKKKRSYPIFTIRGTSVHSFCTRKKANPLNGCQPSSTGDSRPRPLVPFRHGGNTCAMAGPRSPQRHLGWGYSRSPRVTRGHFHVHLCTHTQAHKTHTFTGTLP